MLYKQCQPLDSYDKKTLINLINNINDNEYETTNFDKMLFEELLNFLYLIIWENLLYLVYRPN